MRKTSILLPFLAMFCLPALVAANPVQWSSALGGNDHWYDLTLAPLTWHDADSMATSSVYDGVRGYLVSIQSQAENDFLVQTFGSLDTSYWIGFTDEAQEGIWVWSSGETGSYTNWDPGEPNNLWGGEDCAVLQTWSTHRGYWNDVPVYNPPEFGGGINLIYGIIEYSHMPEPQSQQGREDCASREALTLRVELAARFRTSRREYRLTTEEEESQCISGIRRSFSFLSAFASSCSFLLRQPPKVAFGRPRMTASG
jgi:hypothetical protein